MIEEILPEEGDNSEGKCDQKSVLSGDDNVSLKAEECKEEEEPEDKKDAKTEEVQDEVKSQSEDAAVPAVDNSDVSRAESVAEEEPCSVLKDDEKVFF